MRLQSEQFNFSSLMNSSQAPCFFLYFPNPNYTIFQPYNFPVVIPENIENGSERVQSLQQSCQKENCSKNSRETLKINEKSSLQREFEKKKLKKLQPIKKQEKDAEFKQRQQTANRNLCSNTLKIYFKQLRDRSSQTFLNINKIIKSNKLTSNAQDFIEKVDRIFPSSSTYISFDSIKKVCSPSEEVEHDNNLAIILRTSIVRFFSYQIYTVNIKSIRTTRKIRNQQIKQGKMFMRDLSL